MEIVKNNETKTLVLQNGSYAGVSTEIYLEASATNTAFSGQLVSPEQVTIEVVKIHDDGKNESILSDNLRNLVMFDIDKVAAEFIVDNTKFINYTTAAVGVTAKGILPLKFSFGGTINLHGKERLEVKATLSSATWTTQLSSTNCYMVLDGITGQGTEYFTPKMRSIVIDTNASTIEKALGNNVSDVILVNYDKTDLTSANQVLNTLSVQSKQENRSRTYFQILSKQREYYDDASTAALRNQNFIIYRGEPIDDVKLFLAMNSSNVNSTKNYILFRYHETSAHTINKAVRHDENKLNAKRQSLAHVSEHMGHFRGRR